MKFSQQLFKERLGAPPIKLDKLYIESGLHGKLKVKLEEDGNFWDKVKTCSACTIVKDREYSPVCGVGDLNATCAFFGKSPGKKEGEGGAPFLPSSISGVFLTKYLDVLGLRRDQVYLSNAFFCAFKDDRNPVAHERMVCSFYKASELEVLPKLKHVFLLGNEAAFMFLGTWIKSIVPSYGYSYYVEKFLGQHRKVMFHPVFHMGSVVRDQSLFSAVVEQLRYIKENYIDGQE